MAAERPAALALCGALTGCGAGAGLGPLPFLATPAEPPRTEAALEEGHAAMALGDAEGALRAFRQAALAGAGPDALAAMGTANLALGRLGQAEPLLRRAAEARPGSEAAWNNLGALLMETGRPAEAAGAFRRAYALGDGASDTVRANLVRAQEAMAAPEAPALAPLTPEGALSVTSAPSTEAAAEPAAAR